MNLKSLINGKQFFGETNILRFGNSRYGHYFVFGRGILFELGDKKLGVLAYVAMTMLFLILLLMYSHLIIAVKNKVLIVYFGFGVHKKKIPIDSIELSSIEVVDVPLSYGIGLRYSTKAIVYNTWPGKGLSFKRKNGDKRIIIVTKKIDELRSALTNS